MENTNITAEELRAYDAVAQNNLKSHCKDQGFFDLSLAILHSNSLQSALVKYERLRSRRYRDTTVLRVLLNRYRELGVLEKSEHGEPISFKTLKAQIHAIAHPLQEEASEPTEKSDLRPEVNDASVM